MGDQLGVHDADAVELARLRELTLDPRREVRQTAINDLLEHPLEQIHTALPAILTACDWEDCRPILEYLTRQYARSHSQSVLDLLDRGEPDLLTEPPRNRDAAELQARIHAELALVLLRLGDTEHARLSCDRALELAPSRLSRARARAQHNLGRVLRKERRYDEARSELRAAAAQYREMGDKELEARVLNSLGNVYLDAVELDEADYCYRLSLRLKLEGDDILGQAITCGHLGEIALLRGEYETALEYFYKDRRLSAQIGEHHGEALMANQLARTYLAIGDLDRAWECATAGTEPARRSRVPTDTAHNHRTLAWVALERGDLETCDRHLQRAQELYEATGREEGVADTLLLAGALARARDRFDRALEVLEQARWRFARLDHAIGEAMACLELSLVYQATDEREAQEKMLREGRELANRVGRTTVRQDLHRMHAHLITGRVLVEAGVAAPEKLDQLIEQSYRTGRGLGRLLVARGVLDGAELESFLRDTLGIKRPPPASLAGPQVQDALGRLPQGMAERLKVLPVAVTGRHLRTAMADPLDFQAVEQIELATGLEVEACFVPENELEIALKRALAGPRLWLGRCRDAPEAFDRLMSQAVELGASDVHLEPKHDGFAVRLRTDGVLHQADRLTTELGRSIVIRVKALAGMDVADPRRPDDGRLSQHVDGRDYSLRASTLPCTHGENLVIRILGRAEELSLSELGLDQGTIGKLRQIASRQEGMLLVVGPTGSGKSTTVAAVLQEIDSVRRAVFTVEDPVEYDIGAFTQTQVNPEARLGFAEVLRGLLRQDPDVIFLGEMRDAESAAIATRMALTGHLVFTTLHTYDAVTSVPRLLQMGVPAFTLAAVLKGVMAQRLVRRLCPDCKVVEPVDRQWLRSLDPHGELPEVLEHARVFGARGCEACRHIGYRGRLPVYEFLVIDDELASLIRNGASEDRLLDAGRSLGFKTIHSSALRCVAAGLTSQSEILRVL